MAEVHHFTYGWITPAFSYALSVLGSLLALVCTARARSIDEPGRRARWLLMAAWALGGTGIWVMHFMAMLGFTVPGSPVVYDVPVTIASWVTAIVVVGIGLFIVGYGRRSIFKVLVGGLFAGVGVAAMHYTGMAAMRVEGAISYDRQTVILSVVIAVVAATVALWFTVTLRRSAAIVVAALIMGVAVNGMHFTGMAALRVRLAESADGVAGLPALVFLGPIMLFVMIVVVTLAYAMLRSTGSETGWVYRAPVAQAPRPGPGLAGRGLPSGSLIGGGSLDAGGRFGGGLAGGSTATSGGATTGGERERGWRGGERSGPIRRNARRRGGDAGADPARRGDPARGEHAAADEADLTPGLGARLAAELRRDTPEETGTGWGGGWSAPETPGPAPARESAPDGPGTPPGAPSDRTRVTGRRR